jgi:hypothetical protein
MSTIFLKVKPSATDEHADVYNEHRQDIEESVHRFLCERLEDRMRIINEISFELAQVRCNYEEVLRRLNKYEPTEELPEREYDPNVDEYNGQ